MHNTSRRSPCLARTIGYRGEFILPPHNQPHTEYMNYNARRVKSIRREFLFGPSADALVAEKRGEIAVDAAADQELVVVEPPADCRPECEFVGHHRPDDRVEQL
jgi:hypothetical protein